MTLMIWLIYIKIGCYSGTCSVNFPQDFSRKKANGITDLTDVPAVSQQEIHSIRMESVHTLADINEVKNSFMPQHIVFTQISVN